MKLLTATDICRAVFRDGALDLALAAALLARSSFTLYGRVGLLPYLAEWLCPWLLYHGLRRWVFIPRAGQVRIKAWRSITPLLVVGYLLGVMSAVFLFLFRGPIPPESPLNFTSLQAFLGALAIALFTGWACLGLRRLGLYGLVTLAALLVPSQVLPAFAALALSALPPLFLGLWLMSRFLLEARHVAA